jgi:hypothetical protein
VHNVFYYEDHASPGVMLLFHSSSSVSPITHLHTPNDHHGQDSGSQRHQSGLGPQ